jgi:tetratricopeptide (TPR) repeat protein
MKKISALSSVMNWLFFIVLIVVFGAGCATTSEVKAIVAESNAAILVAQLPDLELEGDPSKKLTVSDPADISRKIESFIAAHPDQKVAISALRVRQAQLYISLGKFELARSAFAQATELKTDRDKALKELAEPMIWCWQNNGDVEWDPPQQLKAQQHLESFDQVLLKLNESPSIRDFLAEMRAYLGLKLASSIQSNKDPRKREVFIKALNCYGAFFTSDDIRAIKSKDFSTIGSDISVAEKRQLRAVPVIKEARDIVQKLQNSGQRVTLQDLQNNPSIQGLGELVLTP